MVWGAPFQIVGQEDHFAHFAMDLEQGDHTPDLLTEVAKKHGVSSSSIHANKQALG